MSQKDAAQTKSWTAHRGARNVSLTIRRVAIDDVGMIGFGVQGQHRARGLGKRVRVDVGLLPPRSVHAAHVEVEVAVSDAVLQHGEEPPIGRGSQADVIVGDPSFA